MKIFLPPDFAKRAVKERISDDDLREAISRAERGLIDAKLGLSLIKQRIPRQGKGRSSGFRSIIAYERGEIAVFLHLFAKSAKANLTPIEIEEYRAVAYSLTNLSDEGFARLSAKKRWRPVIYEQSEQDVSE